MTSDRTQVMEYSPEIKKFDNNIDFTRALTKPLGRTQRQSHGICQVYAVGLSFHLDPSTAEGSVSCLTQNLYNNTGHLSAAWSQAKAPSTNTIGAYTESISIGPELVQ